MSSLQILHSSFLPFPSFFGMQSTLTKAAYQDLILSHLRFPLKIGCWLGMLCEQCRWWRRLFVHVWLNLVRIRTLMLGSLLPKHYSQVIRSWCLPRLTTPLIFSTFLQMIWSVSVSYLDDILIFVLSWGARRFLSSFRAQQFFALGFPETICA